MAESQSVADGNVSRVLEDRQAVADVLRMFRDHRVPLSVHVSGIPGNAPAPVLDVTGQHLLLEAPASQAARTALQQGATFAFSARLEGIYVHAAHNLARPVASPDGIEYFETALPAQLVYQQRRRVNRVQIPLHMVDNGAKLIVRRPNGDVIATIVDISPAGCRVRLERSPVPAFTDNELFKDCRIPLGGESTVTTEAAIRYQSYDSSTHQLFCGVEFMAMPVIDRRRLQQFVDVIAAANQTASQP